MNRTPDEVPVATATPLLRIALISILLVAAVAGLLVASSALIGWLALAVAVVAGPVAVVVDGRTRSRTRDAARPRMAVERLKASDYSSERLAA
jgi:small-conductance mechanosensitive channel